MWLFDVGVVSWNCFPIGLVFLDMPLFPVWDLCGICVTRLLCEMGVRKDLCVTCLLREMGVRKDFCVTRLLREMGARKGRVTKPDSAPPRGVAWKSNHLIGANAETQLYITIEGMLGYRTGGLRPARLNASLCSLPFALESVINHNHLQRGLQVFRRGPG